MSIPRDVQNDGAHVANTEVHTFPVIRKWLAENGSDECLKEILVLNWEPFTRNCCAAMAFQGDNNFRLLLPDVVSYCREQWMSKNFHQMSGFLRPLRHLTYAIAKTPKNQENCAAYLMQVPEAAHHIEVIREGSRVPI